MTRYDINFPLLVFLVQTALLYSISRKPEVRTGMTC